MKKKAVAASDWTTKWIDSVARGQSTMSQRRLSSVEALGGGLATVRRVAKQRGVHVVLLADDEGNQLLAASLNPFKVIC